MSLPKHVRIVEVGPRDGLQNEKEIIPTPVKIEFINRLSSTGLKSIETTSFVSQKRIPQLADAKEVLMGIQKNPGVHYPVLIPNSQGLEKALEAGTKEIAVFSAVSETFSQKNTHCSIAESFLRIEEIMNIAKPNQIPVRGYISCALGCPYEGEMSVQSVLDMAKRLFSYGCYEISIGDTIGVGTPKKAQKLMEALAQFIPIQQLAVHFHDTYGQALANLYACLEVGISVVDSSIAGLGGCPYAKGASGNVATEDVVFMLQGLNIETGVDLGSLIKISQFVTDFTKRPPRSKVAQAKLGFC
jgi:hydroxymethylglutaryl-CoA lyase